MRPSLPISLCVVYLVGTAGCGTFVLAPPIRTTHAGAPARLEPGQIEAAYGAVVPVAAMATGGPTLSLAVDEHIAIEVGGEYLLPEPLWGLAFAGVRYTGFDRAVGRVRQLGDLEAGLGVGAGGVLSCDEGPAGEVVEPRCGVGGRDDGLRPVERIAFGGYLGAGLGVQIHWLSVFSRIRVQVSRATNIQPTAWLTGLVGLGFDLFGRADIHVAGGFWHYYNEINTGGLYFVEIGLGVSADLLPGAR